MAFKRWNKAPSRKPPQKVWEPSEMKIIGWCLNKKIGVSISPDWKNDMSKWKIEININGKTHTDPKQYGDNVYDKVMEYYKYYYKPNTNNNG
tara:strand:- start:179 stop:454 length:276 start_codon:yes stop_codon:yes gene_type:complete